MITISAALDGAFISHVSLELRGYCPGYPGDVIVPLVLFANDPMPKNQNNNIIIIQSYNARLSDRGRF